MLSVGLIPSAASSAHIGVAPPRGYGGYRAGGANVAKASLRLGEEDQTLRKTGYHRRATEGFVSSSILVYWT
jgi:hypothetical protein